MRFRKLAAFTAIALLSSCTARPGLDLSGEWDTTLGKCVLPGTSDQSRLGAGVSDTLDTSKLTRLYPFEGKLVYEKDIRIPRRLAGRNIALTMERTKPSTLRVDGREIGHQTHIYAPHCYIIGPLKPGMHHFAIQIDNTLDEVPDVLPAGHSYSESTQTNWNGILGEFRLEVLPDPYIKSIQVYPDVSSHTVEVKVEAVSSKSVETTLKASVRSYNTDTRQKIRVPSEPVSLSAGLQTLEFTVDMTEDQLLWSEFHPSLYQIELSLAKDKASAHFGMKDFRVEDGRLVLNGNKIIFRGKHDALVFPLTGYPPMDLQSWIDVFTKAREYGINHYRFHSCAPPKAAFDAADIVGIYIQAELPMWGEVTAEEAGTKDFMLREGEMLLDQVGNSPSFMLMGLGNELSGDLDEMRLWVNGFRSRDNRHLYDFGSNNFLGYKGRQAGEDVLITCRTDGPDGNFHHVRSSFSFADADDGGIINEQRPRTDRDYAYVVSSAGIPIIGHETGQFQSYPDYSQIGKYTGVLYPYNLVEFKRRLEAAGMADQQKEFAAQSAAFAAECYKEDIEYYMRTPGMGGFEMLDLQDYPGQGSALVGILDAFLDSKGGMDAAAWRGFCGPLVPLAEFSDFCLSVGKGFEADVLLANYTESVWTGSIDWALSDKSGWQKSGSFGMTASQGEVSPAGHISVSFDGMENASELTLTLDAGGVVNHYTLWLYPDDPVIDYGNVVACSKLDSIVLSQLESGAHVLFVPDHNDIEAVSVGGLFTPDYWNYSMFRKISLMLDRPVSPGTLCVLVDSDHHLFDSFPTEAHSTWQWWSIARNSRPLILDSLPGCRPLVQVIDNVERCHRLGIVTEFKVGEGKLLLCTCDLDSICDTPEGRQFKKSILDYMNSDYFAPEYGLSVDELEALLRPVSEEWTAAGVDNPSDYSQKGK